MESDDSGRNDAAISLSQSKAPRPIGALARANDTHEQLIHEPNESYDKDTC
jgi:hypothetical protein